MKKLTINYYKQWSNGIVPTVCIVEDHDKVDMVGIFYHYNANLDRLTKYAKKLEKAGTGLEFNYIPEWISKEGLENEIRQYKDNGTRIRRSAKTFKADIEQESMF